MGKKNNLGRAIIKDRFKTGGKKHGGSFVSEVLSLRSTRVVFMDIAMGRSAILR